MSQRFQILPGVQVPDAYGAKKVTMSELDKAIAAIPNLAHDLDVARLVSQGDGIIGRARGSGAKLAASGTGYSIVNSAALNNQPALRLDGSAGHWLRMMRAFSASSFTVMVIGTIAAAIRSSIPANSKNLLTIYDASGVQVWARLVASTGNLQFSIGTGGGASLARASTPAADTGAIFGFARNNPDNAMKISLGGEDVATATDTDAPNLSNTAAINVGGGNALSSTVAWSGDIARVVVWERDITLNYPELWADVIASAKARYGIA